MTGGGRPAAPGTRLRHRDLAVLSLYWVAIGYLWQSLGTLIIPELVQSLVGGARKGTALATLEGIGTVMAVVWQPLAGAISDRTRTRWGRRRPFIAAGTAGDVVFLAAIALSGGYLPLLLAYLGLQAASNTAQGPYQGLLPDRVPPAQRGTASGYYGIANLMGILCGTVVAGFVQAHLGRAAALGSIAGLLALTMLITVVAVPDTAEPVEGAFASIGDALRSTFTAPLRHPDFMWLMGSRLLILMGVVGIQSFALYFFSDSFFHGDSARTLTATYTLLGLVISLGILVSWPAARLSDRVGRRAVVCGSGLVAAAGALVLVFSSHEWAPRPVVAPIASALNVPGAVAQTVFAGILLGVAFGAFLSVDWAFITDVIPAEQAGLFMGFSNIATAGSGIIARFVAGLLLDRFNAGPPILGLPGGYPVIFGIFAAWMLIGAALVLKVRRR